VAQDRKLALLEVGCGSGVFLSKLKHLPQVNAMGLEPTNESLVACRAKGLTVCGDMIEAHVTKHPNSYDVVTAFHVLEHIEDPAGFLRHAVKLLRPNGVICIGTPLSPMSFETRWFDPLNHPPHHLTRWSVRSYQEIAQRLGLGVEITLPRASGVLQRTLYSIHLARRGRFAAFSRRMTLLQMAAHPLESVRELATQLTRKRYRGRVVADSVFVRFSAK
jgi:SAM-dependent methyltransferase